MAKVKRSYIREIENAMAFPNGFGYVLDFSDRTIAEFFDDEFGIDFDAEKYSANGTSKRNRLTTLLSIEDAHTAAKVLRTLWERREVLVRRSGRKDDDAEEETKRTFLQIISEIEGSSELPRTDALDRYSQGRTLDELVGDIERDLRANKPEAAMDHLHTYCMGKFAHLLRIRGIDCGNDEPLHSRFGKYRKELLNERDLNPFTDSALKSAISLFKRYNDIRNHHSFAHENPILDPSEARYVFDTISAILIFLRAIEASRYGT